MMLCYLIIFILDYYQLFPVGSEFAKTAAGHVKGAEAWWGKENVVED